MTTNLAIALIQENQNNKATTANDEALAIDGCVAGYLAVAMADANQTPSGAAVLRTRMIDCTGALTAGRNLIVPVTVSGQTVRKEYVLRNSTTGGFAVTIKTPSGTGIAVAAGKTAIVYADGTNVTRVTADV